MFRWLLWAIAAAIRPKMLLIADNLCLRQQLLVAVAPVPVSRRAPIEEEISAIGLGICAVAGLRYHIKPLNARRKLERAQLRRPNRRQDRHHDRRHLRRQDRRQDQRRNRSHLSGCRSTSSMSLASSLTSRPIPSLPHTRQDMLGTCCLV